MPNGGRKGDNEDSWWLDDLCASKTEFLGDPIDGLICEIYRFTGDEHAPPVGRWTDPASVDVAALEAQLRQQLKDLRGKQKKR